MITLREFSQEITLSLLPLLSSVWLLLLPIFFFPDSLHSLHVPGVQVLRAVALQEPNEAYDHMPAIHHIKIILHSASSVT